MFFGEVHGCGLRFYTYGLCAVHVQPEQIVKRLDVFGTCLGMQRVSIVSVEVALGLRETQVFCAAPPRQHAHCDFASHNLVI